MEDSVIYNHRGGGYAVATATKAIAGRASWPFAQLTVRQNDLTFRLFSTKIDLQFSEITQASLTKSGYLVITTADPWKTFGFTGIGLGKVIEQLRSANVPLDDSVSANRVVATSIIFGQLIFVTLFIALLVLLQLGYYHIGPLSGLKYRGQQAPVSSQPYETSNTP